MSIGVFTLAEMIVKFWDAVGHNGAQAWETCYSTIAWLPATQFVRNIVEQMQPLTFRRGNQAQELRRASNSAQEGNAAGFPPWDHLGKDQVRFLDFKLALRFFGLKL